MCLAGKETEQTQKEGRKPEEKKAVPSDVWRDQAVDRRNEGGRGPRDSAERWDLSEINCFAGRPRREKVPAVSEGQHGGSLPIARYGVTAGQGPCGEVPSYVALRCPSTTPGSLYSAGPPVSRAAIATGDVTIVFCTPGPHNRLTAVPPHHTAGTASKLRRYLAAGDCRKRSGGGGLAGKRDGG
jgi:hypothetical protein